MEACLSLGVIFSDARIASVRIAGDVAGPDDDQKHDIVMMDGLFMAK